MGGVGDKVPLGLVGVRQPVERAIDRIDQRTEFFRQLVGRDAGVRVGGADARGLTRGGGEMAQAPGAHQPDQPDRAEAHGNEHQEVLIRVLYQVGAKSG